MNNLLNALQGNIKPAGRDKWTARCPTHNDKDFAMSIKLCSDGSVMAHCHACGANGLDLYQTLGLDLDELFGGKHNSDDFVPNGIREQYKDDKFFAAVYEADTGKGIRPALSDKRRYKLAKARMQGAREKYRALPL